MKGLLLSCVILLGTLTGCAGNNNDNDVTHTTDQNMSDPNTSFNNVTYKHHNISNDQQMIRSTIDSTKHFKPGMVSIIGDNAFINVTYTGDKNRKTYDREVKHLKRVLQGQMPRYDIRLRVTNR